MEEECIVNDDHNDSSISGIGRSVSGGNSNKSSGGLDDDKNLTSTTTAAVVAPDNNGEDEEMGTFCKTAISVEKDAMNANINAANSDDTSVLAVAKSSSDPQSRMLPISSCYAMNVESDTSPQTLLTTDGATCTLQQVGSQSMKNSSNSTLSGAGTFGRFTETCSTLHTTFSNTFNTHSTCNSRHSALQKSGTGESGSSALATLSRAESSFVLAVPASGSNCNNMISPVNRISRHEEISQKTRVNDSNCSTPVPMCGGGSLMRSFSVTAHSTAGDVDAENAELSGAFRTNPHNAYVLSNNMPLEDILLGETFGTLTETVYSVTSRSSTGKVCEVMEPTRQLEDGVVHKSNGSREEEALGVAPAMIVPLAQSAEEMMVSSLPRTEESRRRDQQFGSDHDDDNSPPQQLAPLPLPKPLTDTAENLFFSFVTAMSGSESRPSTARTHRLSTTPAPRWLSAVEDNNAASCMSTNIHESATSDSMTKLSHTATLIGMDVSLLDASPSEGGGDNTCAMPPVPSYHCIGGNDSDGNVDPEESPFLALSEEERMKKMEENELVASVSVEAAESVVSSAALPLEKKYDDDDFGDFMEVAPKPTSMVTASLVEVTHNDDDGEGRQPQPGEEQVSKEEKGEEVLVETTGFPVPPAPAAEAVAVSGSRRVRLSDEPMDIVEVPPMNVNDRHPENCVDQDGDKDGENCTEMKEEEKNGHDNDDEDWAVFTDVSSSIIPQGGQLASSSCEPQVVVATEVISSHSLPSKEGDFVFDKEIDKAVMQQWLHHLLGRALGARNEVAVENRKMHDGGGLASEKEIANPEQKHARGELLLASMKALSFKRRDCYGDANEESLGVDDCFLLREDLSATQSFLGMRPATAAGFCGDVTTNQQKRQLSAAALVDPVAALQIADRRPMRLREDLDVVLLQAHRNKHHVIPVNRVIAKVKALLGQQQQDEESMGRRTHTVWRIHPLLPPPHVGGSVYPAPSLELLL